MSCASIIDESTNEEENIYSLSSIYRICWEEKRKRLCSPTTEHGGKNLPIDINLWQEIWNCTQQFKSPDDAKKLYCSILNYEYGEELPVPTTDWPKRATELIEDARIIAKKDTFFILYFAITKLTLTNERTVLNEVLKRFPECVVIFGDTSKQEFHITNPKFDPEAKVRFVARRYVVGTGERLRTASEQLSYTYAEDSDTATSLKAKHDKAFDVEAVTKEFFEKYKEKLDLIKKDALKKIKGDERSAHSFAQQFLNRLMFLYFIQKKGWLNSDPLFFIHLLERYEKEKLLGRDIFYSDWLKPLFFCAFNKSAIPAIYKLPKELRELFTQMPFLNGGLFQESEADERGYTISDMVVRNVILGFLERFNFTVREDTPLDVEVAVDPEMLGKVYESLVLEEERGKAGIFYTPRVEVDFMCRQSLVEYLVENTKLPYDKLIPFVYAAPEEERPKMGKEELKNIKDALDRVKVVDPACGSGAFLVQMLHVLVELHSYISQQLEEKLDLFELKKRIINENLYGVDIKEWAVRVAELRMWLTLIVDADLSKLDRTKPLLPNFTYKLRCGDSLVQELGGKQISIRAIYQRALPSDTRKAIQELIKLKSEYYYSREVDPKAMERIKQKEIEILAGVINSRLHEIDSETRKLAAVQQKLTSVQLAIPTPDKEKEEKIAKLEEEKQQLKETLVQLRSGEAKRQFFWEIDFAEVFAEGGFDIVIENPPYVRQEIIAPANLSSDEVTDEIKRRYKQALAISVETHWSNEFKKDLKSDMYVYFYYHSLDLLKPGGVLGIISSNSWLDVGFGAKLQEFLLKNIEIKGIFDNRAKRTFAEADINTIIALLKRPKDINITDNRTKFVMFKKPFENVITGINLINIVKATETINIDDYRCLVKSQKELWEEGIESGGQVQNKLDIPFRGRYEGNKWGGKYLRAPEVLFKILEESKGKLTRLENIANVRRGITPGIDEFFYLDNDQIKQWEIEKKYLEPVITSTHEITSPVVDRNLVKSKLFLCNKTKAELKMAGDTGALNYIEWGEKQRTKKGARQTKEAIPFPQASTVRGRRLWYSVPEQEPGDFIIPRLVRERYFVALNKPGLRVGDMFFHGKFKDGKLLDLGWAVLNSTLTFFFLEFFSKINIGGRLYFDGPAIKQLLLPDLNAISPERRKKIVSAFSKIAKHETHHIIDELKMKDRRTLDELVLSTIGIKDKKILDDIYMCIEKSVSSRLGKEKSL